MNTNADFKDKMSKHDFNRLAPVEGQSRKPGSIILFRFNTRQSIIEIIKELHLFKNCNVCNKGNNTPCAICSIFPVFIYVSQMLLKLLAKMRLELRRRKGDTCHYLLIHIKIAKETGCIYHKKKKTCWKQNVSKIFLSSVL